MTTQNTNFIETISGRMATFVAGLKYEDLPVDVKGCAQVVLLDGLGCALAGSTTTELALMRRAAVDAGEGGGNSLLWGTADKAPLPLAALVNGAAVHAREMDDIEGCLHSGSVILPAALGAAVRVGANGKQLLTAIVAGYDIARRALEGVGGHRALKNNGWHSTSVCGGFGAAAAVGSLLRLNAQQIQWALGYAGTTAAGTWAFIADGAMSKRIHPGFAAQSGVIAAYLARNGATGPTSIFESSWGGFFNTFTGDKATPEKATAGLGSDFKIRLVGFKPHAACRGTHGSIDAILELRNGAGVSPESVERVTVHASKTHIKQLSNKEVNSPMEAQFSIPYSIAAALSAGSATLDQYSNDALVRPEVRELARRVDLVLDEAVIDGEQPIVEVHLRDGRALSKRVLVPKGDRENPMSPAELRTKFRANARRALPEGQVDELEAAITNVEGLNNVTELVRLLSPLGVPHYAS